MASSYFEGEYKGGYASGEHGPAPAPAGTPGRRTLTSALAARSHAAVSPTAPTFGTPSSDDSAFWFAATPAMGDARGGGGGAPGNAATGAAGLVVEDGQRAGPGQMSKSEFLREASQLMPGEDLAKWQSRSAGEIESAVRKQVTGAAGAKSARGYLDAIRAQAQAATGGAAPAGGTFAAVDRSEAGIRDHVRTGGLGEGQALPAATRAAMERAYGHGFGDVRVHTDAHAAGLADNLGARAFTVGSNIAFAAGNFAPGSALGDALLAHELAHVVQQRGASSTSTGGGAHEADADQAAAQAMSSIYAAEMASGAPATPALKAGVGVQRCDNGSTPATPSALTFTASAFTPGAGGAVATDVTNPSQLVVNSAAFASSGSVAVAGGTDADAQGWDIGYLQTVRSSRRTGHYTGSPTNTKFEVTLPANTRDGNPAGVAPWYDSANATAKHAVSKTAVTETASLWDRPGMGFAWDTPDGKGKLASTDGKDQFAAWLVVRKRASPNTIQYINWETWEVNWATTTTYASAGTKTAAATGATASTGSGAGQGANTPNLTGAVANNVAAGGWS